MSTFDPKVWTTDSAGRPGLYFVAHATYTDKPGRTVRVERLEEHECLGMVNGVAPRYRSILPIPSAEEIAALVELGDACLRWREEDRKWHEMPGMTKREMEEWETQQSVVGACYGEYLAALARLDAARKERTK